MLLVTKCCLSQDKLQSLQLNVKFTLGWASYWECVSFFESPGLTQLRCHGKSKDSIVLIFTASAGTIAWVHERLLASNLMYSCHKSSLKCYKELLENFSRMNTMICIDMICEEGMLHVLVVLWLI